MARVQGKATTRNNRPVRFVAAAEAAGPGDATPTIGGFSRRYEASDSVVGRGIAPPPGYVTNGYLGPVCDQGLFSHWA